MGVVQWATMNLYLRLFLLLFRLIGLKRKGLFEESRVAFRVLPNDCDINFHMNNGRYLAFMDLGRVHLMAQLRLLGLHDRHGLVYDLVAFRA